MNFLLTIGTVFVLAIVMTPALAHALEMPGKLRLDRQAYLTVQPIQGFAWTLAGLKAFLEHGLELGLVEDKNPDANKDGWRRA